MTDPALEKIVFHFRSGPRKGDVTSFIQAHITIGRAADSDLVFDSRDDRNVSSHHAVIRFQNQRFRLADSRSTNGTYINGERLERAILKSGDVIRLGALGPEIEVSIPAETLERTLLDSDQLDLASMTRDSASASKLSDPEVNEKVLRLRHVRFIRNTMVVAIGAAAGIAGFIWTLIEGFELTPPGQYFRAALSLIAGGVILTLVIAVYHGRAGRQRFRFSEMLWMGLVVLLSLAGAYFAWGGG
jgi:hypothetical protein